MSVLKNVNPYKMKLMNNKLLVKNLANDIDKSKYLEVVKMNNSTKLRSNYVGLLIKRCDFYVDDKNRKWDISQLVEGETIVTYVPQSVIITIEYEDEMYHIIRAEDTNILEGYDDVSQR